MGDQLEQLREVLDATEVTHSALKRGLDDAATAFGSSDGTQLCCCDAAVSQSLECALLDYVSQLSRDAAETEKKRRKLNAAEAVRPATGWRAALEENGGSFFCDGGTLEGWLDQDVKGRTLAYDLSLLQAAARRWYGQEATQYCENWQSSFSAAAARVITPAAQGGCSSAAVGIPALCKMLEDELQAFREALFAFPERPGELPVIFRDNGEANAAPTGTGVECAFVAEKAAERWGLEDAISLE